MPAARPPARPPARPQVPCSSAFLTFDQTPVLETRWRQRQAAAWAAGWDGPGRYGDIGQKLMGLVAMLLLPPPGSRKWPIIAVLIGLPVDLLLLAMLRWMDRRRYLRHRTAIVLASRAWCFAAAVLVNRQTSMHGSISSSPHRKARFFHVCVGVRLLAAARMRAQECGRPWLRTRAVAHAVAPSNGQPPVSPRRHRAPLARCHPRVAG